MTVFGTLFFFFKYFVDKYNMLYVYRVEFESNGMTVNTLIRYTIIGIVFFNVYAFLFYFAPSMKTFKKILM